MQRLDRNDVLALEEQLEKQYMTWKDRKRAFIARVQTDPQEIKDLPAEIGGVEQDLDCLLRALSHLHDECCTLSLPYLGQLNSNVCNFLSEALKNEEKYLMEIRSIRTSQDSELSLPSMFASWKRKMMGEGTEWLTVTEESFNTLISALKSSCTNMVYVPPEFMGVQNQSDFFS